MLPKILFLVAVLPFGGCVAFSRDLQVEANSTEPPAGFDNVEDTPTPGSTWIEGESIGCPDGQYLDDTDGCRCPEGLAGMNCGFCLNSEACQARYPENSVCRSSFAVTKRDTQKAYQCRFPESRLIFPGGNASLSYDLESGSINVRFDSNSHAMDCALEGCESIVEPSGITCETVNCTCTRSCVGIFGDMVQGYVDKPASIFISDSASAMGDEQEVALAVDGVFSGITMFCNSSSCVEPEACPTYRDYDFENPDTPIYGAPDGCECWSGLEGVNCGYCLNSRPCQRHTKSHVCRMGFEFAKADTQKAYKCTMANQFQTLFPGGRGSLYFDLEGGFVNVSVFNSLTVNSYHLMDCSLTGCDSKVGQRDTQCQEINCTCTSQCASWFASAVESFAGFPAEIQVTETNDQSNYEKLVSFVVEKSDVDIAMVCTASTCTEANPEVDSSDFAFEALDQGLTETQDSSNNNLRQSEVDSWSNSGRLSLFILCITFTLFVLVGGFALIPFMIIGGSSKGTTEVEAAGRLALTAEDDNIETQCKHVLEFSHLSRTVHLKGKAAKAHGQDKKALLNNVAGRVESGCVFGIMGPSGAGKSSLLNTLAVVETSHDTVVSGQILLNGVEQMKGYRRAVAYVYQDDALYGTLTVQECIEYSAMMRLPIKMKVNRKQALVWKTMEELHLVGIAHSRIGSSGHASISGGERRRVSIGMGIVGQAPVLCLDEPTSGLDSTAASNLMSLLKELASRNRIVILSIHQPSIRSFLLMDEILVLGGGRAMYTGKPSEVKGYLEDKGFNCPDDQTVPDFMLDVISDEVNHDVLKGPPATRSDYDKLRSDGRLSSTAEGSDEPLASLGDSREAYNIRAFVNEVRTLFVRTARACFRNMELFLMQVIISIILAFFAGGIFNDVSNNLAGFQNRLGAFYFSLSFFGFASFSSMDLFVSERTIFERETGSKMYTAWSYFVAKTSLDLFVLRVLPVTIFSLVFYWLMGLSNEAEKFVIFWATMVLFNICAGIMSICVSIAAPTVGLANLLAVVWFLIMLLFGGFLVNIDSMAGWYGWLRYLSIYFYAFELLVTNELNGLLFTFDAPGFPTLPVWGEVFVETISMSVDHQTRNILCLCGLAAGSTLLSYLLLLLRVPLSAPSYFKRMQSENEKLANNEGVASH